jgi:hypothetical protein
MPIATKYLFIVSMDVTPEKEALFNEVYDTEHVPMLLELPGVPGGHPLEDRTRCLRDRGRAQAPRWRTAARYVAMYEIDQPGHPGEQGVERGGGERALGERSAAVHLDTAATSCARSSEPRQGSCRSVSTPAELRPAFGGRLHDEDRRRGEAMGFDYLTMTDHVVLPDTKVPGYPYSESGEFYEDAPTERHEQLLAMAYIAAKTTRIRLVAAVLVVPHRPAVLAAKMLATLDVLSNGRLVVGVGAGWLKTEFDAVVTTPFPERGAVTDEYIDAFRVLWTEPAPRFAAATRASTASSWSPSLCSIRTRRSGSAARAALPCAAAARIGDLWYPDRQQQQAPSRYAAAFSAQASPASQGHRRGRSRS